MWQGFRQRERDERVRGRLSAAGWAAAGAAGILMGLLAGGCPGGAGGNGVSAAITISSQSGPAPLTVTVSAGSSTSTNGAITAYAWDFAGEATSDLAQATHTFATPGRHRVSLIVSDETGESDSTGVDVRVQGGPANAVISASVTSGQGPLTVVFSGIASTAEGDAIADYFWDFGDAGESRVVAPTHTFVAAGTYTVALRVVSFGGVEDTAELVITVTESSGHSLQFNGSQSASLSVTASGLSTFTLEAWAKADASGGTLLRLGTPVVTLELLPDENLVRVRAGVLEYQATVSNLDADWRYIALVNGTTGATIYIDGEAVGTGTALIGLNLSQITLGSGFRGNATGVRLWSTARTPAQIATDMNGPVPQGTSGLLADWPIDEGSGQTLDNRVASGVNGTLGVSGAAEASDPAWSNDAP